MIITGMHGYISTCTTLRKESHLQPFSHWHWEKSLRDWIVMILTAGSGWTVHCCYHLQWAHPLRFAESHQAIPCCIYINNGSKQSSPPWTQCWSTDYRLTLSLPWITYADQLHQCPRDTCEFAGMSDALICLNCMCICRACIYALIEAYWYRSFEVSFFQTLRNSCPFLGQWKDASLCWPSGVSCCRVWLVWSPPPRWATMFHGCFLVVSVRSLRSKGFKWEAFTISLRVHGACVWHSQNNWFCEPTYITQKNVFDDSYLNSSYVATFWCTARNLASFSLEYFLSASSAPTSSRSSLSRSMGALLMTRLNTNCKAHTLRHCHFHSNKCTFVLFLNSATRLRVTLTVFRQLLT